MSVDLICLKCGAVFDEDCAVSRVIEWHRSSNRLFPEYACTCPECKSPEISRAFRCGMCDRMYELSRRRWHPLKDIELCEECYKIVEVMIDRGCHNQTS